MSKQVENEFTYVETAPVNLTIKVLGFNEFKSGFKRIRAVVWNKSHEKHGMPIEINISKSASELKFVGEDDKKAPMKYEDWSNRVWNNTVFHIKHEAAQVHQAASKGAIKVVIWAFDSEDPKKQLLTLSLHERNVETKLEI